MKINCNGTYATKKMYEKLCSKKMKNNFQMKKKKSTKKSKNIIEKNLKK